MYEKTITIKNKIGLHARPASKFVDAAKKYESKIRVVKDEITVDAKSIVMLLSLGAKQGDQITIRAEGEDETKAVNDLVEFILNLEE